MNIVQFNFAPFGENKLLGKARQIVLKTNGFKTFFLPVIFMLLSMSVIGQSTIVSGSVSSDDGKRLEGATITLKGSNVAVISDNSGNFRITFPANTKKPILVFSFLSYTPKEVSVNNSDAINVVLQLESKSLSDVVVVGYGSARRKDLTGSVSSIKRSDFENQPLADVTQTLKGLAPGVSVTQNSGAPGADIKIRIRGISSILGNNSPLLVIDGVQSFINLNDINPNDIESIEILKDASSTAIYGSRGANGVIIITTKRGDKNSPKPKIEFNSFVSLKKAAFKYDILSPIDYANLHNVLFPGRYTSQDLDYINAFGGTDWQDILVQTGVLRSSSLTITGGNANTSYLFSGNIVDEDGLVINTDRKRYALRTNIQTKITDKLTIGLNLAVSVNNTKNVARAYTEIWDAVNWGPTELVYKDDNTYNPSDRYGSIRRNPYMNLKERNSVDKKFLGIAGANLSYEILPSLTFSTIFGTTYSPGSFAFANNKFIDPIVSAGQGAFNSVFWQTSNTLTYRKSFNTDHKVTAMAGFEQQKRVSTSFSANGNNFLLPAVGFDNLGLAASTRIASNFSEEALRSYFGRGTYSFKNKYLLTVTYRADGSSKFRGDNRYSYFPSAAVAWKLSQENFIQKLNVFDDLKLRASWGITGNQAISAYSTIGLLTPYTHNFGTTAGFPGYIVQGAGNPDLKWEETKQFDLGVDASLFNNRLSFTADYYIRRTTGLLQATALPAYNGGGSIVKNIGEMLNSGIDVGLNFNAIKTNNLNWNSSVNFSFLNNEIISLGDKDQLFPPRTEFYVFESNNSHVVKVGQPLGAFWGMKHLGIWQANEATQAAVYGNKPGDNKFLDYNGDSKINGDDFHVIGQSLPKFRWGFNNTLTYKKFTFNFLIEGVSGNSVFNGQFASGVIPSSNGKTITISEGANYWTASNLNAKYPNPFSPTNQGYAQSSQWLQDGSFIRCRNLSLAYDFDKSKLKFANVKIYASVQNLFTITKYIGSDPEASVSNQSDSYGGYDAGSFPTARAFSIGFIISN